MFHRRTLWKKLKFSLLVFVIFASIFLVLAQKYFRTDNEPPASKSRNQIKELSQKKITQNAMQGDQEYKMALKLEDWTQSGQNSRRKEGKKEDILIPYHEPITHDPFKDLLDSYLPLKGLDYAAKGDFPCSYSLAIDSCLVHRRNVRDFQIICDRIGSYCKGFVVTRGRIGEIIAYFKHEIKLLKRNNQTVTFVKRDFLDKVKFPETNDKVKFTEEKVKFPEKLT